MTIARASQPVSEAEQEASVIRAIRLNYFLRIPNVGDRVNPHIVSGVSGYPTIYSDDQDAAHLMAAGSTMAGTTRQSRAWGTGVMHPSRGVGGIAARHIHAVRGKLSHAALRAAGVAVRDVPLGDPGFLAPKLLGISKGPHPARKIGVVAHYVDRRHPLLRRLLAAPDAIDLNVHDDPSVFLRRMAACAAVVSSSLHGLIFAEALGIPSLWVTVSGEIAGGDFKYADWFSTTARPQTLAYQLTSSDNIHHLARRAELRESTIDAHSLVASFPAHDDEIRSKALRKLLPVAACRRRPTPTFIISFNRGAMLERTIAAIRRLARPVEIVIHDNGSTDPQTCAVLDTLEQSSVRVFRRHQIQSADDLNLVNDTVQAFFADWAEPARYVVTDDDIDMGSAAVEALDVYDELLNIFARVESVGPMLRIRDIPPSYPLYNRVMNRHIEQFWRNAPTLTDTSFGQIAVLPAPIDTTFALHRAGESFRRLKRALRVYEPYEARHLDWYPQDDDDYTRTSSAAVAHWNNAAQRAAHANERLVYDRYNAVRIKRSGTIEVYQAYVAAPEANTRRA